MSSAVGLTVWMLLLVVGHVEVSGVHYGRLGSSVTLACGASPPSLPVSWRVNNSLLLPPHRVEGGGALTLLHVGLLAQGSYSCHDDRGAAVHTVQLLLGYPPGRLNVSCRVPNHTLVRCSWTQATPTLLPSHYVATYSSGTSGQWQSCVLSPANQSCDITGHAFWISHHWLNVTEANMLGVASTLEVLDLTKLLKPNPPCNLTLSPLFRDPTHLLLSWELPAFWSPEPAFPLLFQVQYRPQHSAYWSELEASVSHVLIPDALAGHDHEARVRARDDLNLESQWSEWSPLVVGGPWEELTAEPSLEPRHDDDDDNDNDVFQETATGKTLRNGGEEEEEEERKVATLLVLFSVVVLTSCLALSLFLWLRQRRKRHVTKQEVTSGLKLKPMPL